MNYMRTFRFLSRYALNLLIAVIGTAIIESDFWPHLRFHDRSIVIVKEYFFSIVIAALLGFLVYWKWPNEASKWIWIAPTVWLGFGAITIAGQQHSVFSTSTGLWPNLSGKQCAIDVSSCRAFFAYTVPLMRSVSYSLAGVVAVGFQSRRVSGSKLKVQSFSN
jgi:hypothetical protein